MTQAPPPPQQDVLSHDGNWRWDGTQWVANQATEPRDFYPSPPPVTRSVPTGGAPAWAPPPLASPGPRMTPGATAPAWPARPPMSPATRGVGFQFSGNAMWSIIFGVASIAVPLFTPIYFPILPIFGLWRGVLALQQGRVAGGVIGLIVSGIGCLFSLLASGLLNSLLH